MTQSVHEQARELLALDGTENLPDGRRTWLQVHLQECAACRNYAEAAGQVVRALRAQPLAADSALVRATQRRVRSRARELRQQRERMWLVGASCFLVGLTAAVTAPLFWRAFAWLGLRAGASGPVWEASFTLFWIAPALAASVLLLARGTHLANHGERRWR
jgi:predicted anti-sigma-YlaC factor YlaD